MSLTLTLEDVQPFWTEDEIETFYQIYNEYAKDASQRSRYTERLKLQFPNAQMEAIQKMDEFIEQRRWEKTETRALL